MMVDGTTIVPKSDAIPITPNELTMLDPRTLPTTISDLPCLAADITTKSSGSDVPSATAPVAMISVAMLSVSEISTADMTVYLAEMNINIALTKKVMNVNEFTVCGFLCSFFKASLISWFFLFFLVLIV